MKTVRAQETLELAREVLTGPEAMSRSAVYSSDAFFCLFHMVGRDAHLQLLKATCGSSTHMKGLSQHCSLFMEQ